MNNANATRSRLLRSIGTLLMCGALVLSACGDDDDASEDASGTTTDDLATPTDSVATTTSSDATTTTPSDITTDTAESTSAEPAVCEPFLQLSAAFAGQPDPAEVGALLDDVDANAPDEIADELTVLTTNARRVLDTGDFSAFENPEFEAAVASSESWITNNCEFATRTEIIAADYRYEGQATEYPTGRAAFTVINEGEELHELTLLRKNDGVDLTLAELMELPETEAETMTTYVGGVFVGPPGASGNLITELTPGNYIAVCNIPTGTVVADDGAFTEGTGEPHVTLGMSFEFTVA